MRRSARNTAALLLSRRDWQAAVWRCRPAVGHLVTRMTPNRTRSALFGHHDLSIDWRPLIHRRDSLSLHRQVSSRNNT